MTITFAADKPIIYGAEDDAREKIVADLKAPLKLDASAGNMPGAEERGRLLSNIIDKVDRGIDEEDDEPEPVRAYYVSAVGKEKTPEIKKKTRRKEKREARRDMKEARKEAEKELEAVQTSIRALSQNAKSAKPLKGGKLKTLRQKIGGKGRKSKKQTAEPVIKRAEETQPPEKRSGEDLNWLAFEPPAISSSISLRSAASASSEVVSRDGEPDPLADASTTALHVQAQELEKWEKPSSSSEDLPGDGAE